jgi:hypothetical protein
MTLLHASCMRCQWPCCMHRPCGVIDTACILKFLLHSKSILCMIFHLQLFEHFTMHAVAKIPWHFPFKSISLRIIFQSKSPGWYLNFWLFWKISPLPPFVYALCVKLFSANFSKENLCFDSLIPVDKRCFCMYAKKDLIYVNLRWIAATAVSVAVVTWGHQRKSLSTTGALLAIIGSWMFLEATAVSMAVIMCSHQRKSLSTTGALLAIIGRWWFPAACWLSTVLSQWQWSLGHQRKSLATKLSLVYIR